MIASKLKVARSLLFFNSFPLEILQRKIFLVDGGNVSRVERNLIENKKEEEAEEEEEDEALLVRKGRGKSVGSRSISFPSMRGDVTRVVQINDHWRDR